MPADASIYGQIQPVRPRNALADFADVMQIQGLQQRAQLGQMQMDEARRARSQEEALAGAYRNALAPDGTINRNALFSGVAGAGLGHKLPGIQESFAKSDKAKVEAEKERLALAREKVGFVGQLLGSVTDQATYDAARQTAQANGLDVSNMPPQFDPAFIEAKRQETLTVAQQLEQMWKAKEFGHKERTAAETVRHNQATERTAAGNLRVAQDNLGLRKKEFDLASGNAVADAGGPSQVALTKQFGKAEKGFRWKPDGSQEPIPGGSADHKSGIEGAKARSRAEHAVSQANVVIDTIDKALANAGPMETGLTGAALGRVPGTDAYNLRRQVDTVKANIGFDTLQKMRDMSPTGGALGQVAVQELSMLQATIGNLDANQSQEELTANLQKARQHYTNWKNVMQQAAGGGAASAPAPGGGAVPRVASDADYSALPSGAEFIDPQGNRRRKP